jgi:hypothetical protein
MIKAAEEIEYKKNIQTQLLTDIESADIRNDNLDSIELNSNNSSPKKNNMNGIKNIKSICINILNCCCNPVYWLILSIFLGICSIFYLIIYTIYKKN